MKTIHAGLLVCILLKLVEAVPLASFYTFGPSAGDTTLRRNDDQYSPLISLSTEFSYFGTNHDAVYVRMILYHYLMWYIRTVLSAESLMCPSTI